MQAIRTRYLGPTDTRGSRLKAACQGGTLTLPYPYELEGEQAHRVAAEALRDRLGWSGELVGGHMDTGDYAFVFARSGP